MADRNDANFIPGVPLYRQVQDKIQEMLRTNKGAEGLPLTDSYLVDYFGVSRITVRKAVEGLVDAGWLYRVPKLGTFVRPGMFREKLTLTSFLDPWSEASKRLQIRIGRFDRVKAAPEIANSLQVKNGEEIVYVQRLRFQGDKLVVVDDRYLRVIHARRLTDKDILTSSFVDYFQKRLNVQIENGEMEIEARGANAKEAKAFGIRAGQPVLGRRITLFNRKRPLLTGVSVYRADRVSYRVMISNHED